ncbi:hypothetical protein R3W88_016629 [Solanum pinnatisectum]|uniref:Uncharacterized protein n=1 Tax=Solanum pinnatisectum TaxID=50273 RepID=A0AAV9KY82_9SOLN|nr:hypothetical protein R3W88_016629 [Solanum pinnatisectum]
MTSLTIDSCSKIGNKSPKVVGQYCPNLKLDVLKNCPLIRDKGIEDLFYSAGPILTEVELQALHISDISLKIISHHGTALKSLAVGELRRVIVREFWVMGIEPSVRGMPLDYPSWIFGILLKCGKKLKNFSLVKCLSVKDLINAVPSKAPCCNSLVSLTIRNCLGVGNATVVVVGRLCHKLTYIELSGLLCIADEGLFHLVNNCEANLVAMNLSGCVNITDKSISAIIKLNGKSLKSLLVDGCRHVLDATLVEIWNSCWMLNVLDISKCGITNSGITTLSSAIQLHLQILSLSGCPLVSNNSLPLLLDLVQNLQGLNIQQCPNIISRTVDALIEINPGCDILS